MSSGDTSQRVIPYSRLEREGLQAQLDGMLGPEYVNYRPAPGGSSVAYLRGDVAVTLANEIFGFNGWSSEIKDITIDEKATENGPLPPPSIYESLSRTEPFVRYIPPFFWQTSSASETYRCAQDIGTGESQNQRTKSAAIVASKKQAVTDALKRTFRTFGNALGNCLYDKQHIKGTRRMKAAQPVQEPNYYKPRSMRDRIVKQEESLITPGLLESLPEVPREKIISENDLAEGFDEYGGDEYDYLGAFEDGGDFSEHVADEDIVEAVSSDNVFKRSTPPTPTGAKSTAAQAGGNHALIAPKNQNIPALGPQKQNGQHGRSSPNIPAQSPAQQSRPFQTQNRGPQMLPQNSAIGHRPLQKPPNAPQGPRTPTPAGQLGPRVNSIANNTAHNLRNAQQPGPKISPPPPHIAPQSVPVLPAPSLNPQPEAPINHHHNTHVGFFTSKVLLDPNDSQKVLQGDSGVISPDHVFNPHKESTIPRSAGIDHSKSSPIPRKQIQAGGSTGSPFARKNFENPSSELNRQIGQPPLPRGTGAFRQPTPSVGGFKRPADTNAPGAASGPGRSTLGDSSGSRLNAQTSTFGSDSKRVKN
ncbi:unnamed protein product [Tuber aestivum]|uniref:Uncharacterized protein n=1 Tax=Tuber aestivum TaxID=59557 RepID=A0A292PPX8_9PEZI|nr:unnamed protein product [Tuber aestivum]